MSIVQGDLVGQIIENGQDAMGQWVYVKLAAKNDLVVMVITAYQLCKTGKKNGTTAYHQQVAMSQQAERSINPQDTFTQDLLDWMLA
eukprot:1530398-Ditylum_brightwellii.AAC.1